MAFFLIVPSVMIVSVLLVHAFANRLGLRIYYTTLIATAILAFMVEFATASFTPAIGREYLLRLALMILAASCLLTLANRFLLKKQREEEKSFDAEVKAAYEAEKKKNLGIAEETPVNTFDWNAAGTSLDEKNFSHEEISAKVEELPADTEILSKVDDKPADNEILSKVEESSADNEILSKVDDAPADNEILSKVDELPADNEILSKVDELPADNEILSKVDEPPADNEISAKVEESSADSEILSKVDDKPADDEILSKVEEPPADNEILSKVDDVPADNEILSKVEEPPADDEISAKVEEPPADNEILSKVDEPHADNEISAKVDEPPADNEISAEAKSELLEKPVSTENFPLEKVFTPLHELKNEDADKPIELPEEPELNKDLPVDEVFKPLSEAKPQPIEPVAAPVEKKAQRTEFFPLQEVFQPLSTLDLEKLEEITQEEKTAPNEEETKPEEKIATLDELLDKAYDERDKGHVWQAIETYKKALKRYRNDDYAPFVAIDLGNIYKEQALYTKAIKTYEKALNLPAVKRNESIKKEFVNNLQYLSVVRDVLLKYHSLSTPFSQISKEILQEVDIEFKKVQINSAQ